jgi:hypothetical protein
MEQGKIMNQITITKSTNQLSNAELIRKLGIGRLSSSSKG